MSRDWQHFWSSYRRTESVEHGDLLRQVGRTVGNVPISASSVALLVDRVTTALDLQKDDTLLDLCCGNGAITVLLAPRVRDIVAVDFAVHLIEAARLRCACSNIVYKVEDATKPADDLIAEGQHARKFLMNAALSYFKPHQLEDIVQGIVAHVRGAPFRFHMTDVPDEARKWNFYDTPSRRERYKVMCADPAGLNDGLGRWWSRAEIEGIALRHGLVATVSAQPLELSNYRMDATLERR